MDQTYNEIDEKKRVKAREVLRSTPYEELSYILGRYCGPSNQILSEKKFGFIMPKDLVEKEIFDRTAEEFLLK